MGDMEQGWTAVADPARLDFVMNKTAELQEMAAAFLATDEPYDTFRGNQIVELLSMVNTLRSCRPTPNHQRKPLASPASQARGDNVLLTPRLWLPYHLTCNMLYI
jgi:hypothetical protein